MTPEQIKQLKLAVATEIQRRKDVKEYDPTTGMSTGEKFLAGFGKSSANIIGKLLPKSLEPSFVNHDEKLDEPLMKTGAGLAGNITGDIVNTLPIGMGAGMAMGKAAQGATGIARLLAARPVQAAAQGALEGGLTAGEGQSAGGAGTGAAIGTAMSALPVGVGKLTRALGRGPVERIPEAEALTRIVRRATGDKKAMIPISQATGENSLVGDLYRGLVANLPGGGRVRTQLNHAIDQFRETALFRAVPYGVRSDEIFKAPTASMGPEDIQGGIARLQSAWDDAFKPVNNATFKTPRMFSMFKRVNDMLEKEFQVRIPKGNQTVKGQELTEVRKKISQLQRMVKGERDRKLLKIAAQRIDETIKGQLPPDQAMIYGRNQQRWKFYRDLMEGVKKEKTQAKFTPTNLASAASTRAGEKGLGGGGGKMQHLGNLGQEALKGFPSKRGIFQMAAAFGGVNALGGGLGALTIKEDDTTAEKIAKVGAGFAAPYAGARVLSNPTVQRKLTEGFAGPAVASKLLDEYARALRAAGLTSRQIAVALATNDEE